MEGKGESSGLQDQANSRQYQLSYKFKQLSSKSKQEQEWGEGGAVWRGRVAEITWEQSGVRGLGVLLRGPSPSAASRANGPRSLGGSASLAPQDPKSIVSFSCPDSPTSGPPPQQTFVCILLLTQLHCCC